MAEIITQLPGLKKRMLLSATDAEEIPQFTGLNRTVKLNFLPDASEEQESRLTLMKVISPSKDKIDTLYNLLCTLGSSSSIVFCNHRDAVDRVHKLLAEKKLFAERFHGGMEQPDRERALCINSVTVVVMCLSLRTSLPVGWIYRKLSISFITTFL